MRMFFPILFSICDSVSDCGNGCWLNCTDFATNLMDAKTNLTKQREQNWIQMNELN